MKTNNFLKSSFPVKGTKEELSKLEPLFIKAGVKNDKKWNDIWRKSTICDYIFYLVDNKYFYVSNTAVMPPSKRDGLSYKYVRTQLLKIIKDNN